MNDQKKPKVTGVVIEPLPDATFRVQLEDGTVVLAYLAGKMRLHYVKVMLGDKVTLEISPDRTRGRIVYRNYVVHPQATIAARAASLSPDFAVVLVDTHLRMKDKLVPLLSEALRMAGEERCELTRIERRLSFLATTASVKPGFFRRRRTPKRRSRMTASTHRNPF